MDEAAVDTLRQRQRRCHYDASSITRRAGGAVAHCDAFIVRNWHRRCGTFLCRPLCQGAWWVARRRTRQHRRRRLCGARHWRDPATGANALAVAEYVIGTAMLLRGEDLSTAEVTPAASGRATVVGRAREPPARSWELIGFGSISPIDNPSGALPGRAADCPADPALPATHSAWQESAIQARTLERSDRRGR